jgi:transcriptional regulator with XRE-family HTH domain
MEEGPLARLREMGLTQTELSQLLCVTQATISHWETGARQPPARVEGDLWELLRVVEARVRDGMDIRQAVQGWRPSVILNPGGPVLQGVPVPIPTELAEALAREGGDAVDQFMHTAIIDALVKTAESPMTAERCALVRRLSQTLEMDADIALRFMGEEEG